MLGSKLKDRASKVREAGRLERRTWNPEADSWHCRRYQWWLQKTGKNVPMENFCHYWRVVFIWATLRLLVKPMKIIVPIVFLTSLAVVSVKYSTTVLVVAIATAALAYVVLGVWISVYFILKFSANSEATREHNRVLICNYNLSWLNRSNMTVKSTLAVIFLPVELLILTLFVLASAVGYFFIGLHEDYDFYRRVLGWPLRAHFSARKEFAWIRPWLVLPITLVALAFWYEWALIVTGYLAIVLGVVGFMLGLIFIGDWLKRYLEVRRIEKALTTYRFVSEYHSDESDDVEFIEPSPPSRLKRIAGGILGTLSLIWSVIITKKMKICPIVEIPKSNYSN